MLTFRAETVDDIENALPRLGRLPRGQRITYLNKAKSKLLVWARKGYDVQDLRMRVHRTYAKEKQRHDRQQARKAATSSEPESVTLSEPQEEPAEPYEIVDKSLYDLDPGEAKHPNSDRYHGLTVACDEDGFYATDGKERTESYDWSGAIPEREILDLVDEDNPDT